MAAADVVAEAFEAGRLQGKTEWPLIERVRILDLGPNDTVVLECSQDVSQEQAVEIKHAWFNAMDREKPPPIVLTNGLTVAAVIRDPEA